MGNEWETETDRETAALESSIELNSDEKWDRMTDQKKKKRKMYSERIEFLIGFSEFVIFSDYSFDSK